MSHTSRIIPDSWPCCLGKGHRFFILFIKEPQMFRGEGSFFFFLSPNSLSPHGWPFGVFVTKTGGARCKTEWSKRCDSYLNTLGCIPITVPPKSEVSTCAQPTTSLVSSRQARGIVHNCSRCCCRRCTIEGDRKLGLRLVMTWEQSWRPDGEPYRAAFSGLRVSHPWDSVTKWVRLSA